MKKGVIAVLLIVVVIVIVSPGIIGKLAEKSVDENLNWAADESGEFVVTSTGFDSGWFSSEGQHRIELGEGNIRTAMVAGGNDETPVLIIDTRIDHGIIPVTSMSREEGSLAPGLGSAVSTMTVEYADGENFKVPGTIYSKVGLTGDLASSYVLEAGTQSTNNGMVTWEPGKIDFAASPSSGSIVFDGDLGLISAEEDDQKVSFDGLKFSGEQEQTKHGFAVGDVDLSVGEISINSGVAGGIRSVNLKASSALDGDDVNADMLLIIDGQTVPNFGEISITTDMSLSGADAAALGALTQRLEEASGSQDPTAIMQNAEEELKSLFAGGFDMNIKQLDIALPMGTVETVMNFEVPESDRADFEWTSLLVELVASLDVKVPEELVNMATQMNPQAGMVVGMGYLKKNGDNYEMNAAYKQGLLTINGAPVPIPFGAF